MHWETRVLVPSAKKNSEVSSSLFVLHVLFQESVCIHHWKPVLDRVIHTRISTFLFSQTDILLFAKKMHLHNLYVRCRGTQ
jgi:hypothetical protein